MVPMRLSVFLLCSAALAQPLPRDTGYRGIWYFNQPSGDQYVYKYSGGFATYPQQHAPIAVYAPRVRKTFFVYGGTIPGKYNQLVHMVSYYDHATGRVPRPAVLLDKQTGDAHDNPTLAIDAQGYLWVFSSAHGTSRPSFIHRSRRPYSIDEFELVSKTNFSYTQPWYLPGSGFLFLHTRYQSHGLGAGTGRALYWMTSPDGRQWSEPHLLAFALMGHYQVSWPHGNKVGTAFNVHPPPLGLNQRTNLYYLETPDAGQTWRTAAGEQVAVPLRTESNAALVHDYRADGQLVYLKDLQYDAAGRPVILFLTSKGYESGPAQGARTLQTAHWRGSAWQIRKVAETDHNYDHGSLYIEPRRWRVIAPTAPGPQPFSTGGDIEEWVSPDEGKTWTRAARWTKNSLYNHTYVRRPLNADPGFIALWADGNPLKPSESSLYFADSRGRVFQLPPAMKSDTEKPRRIR